MTIEEAREYWCKRLERAEGYSDEHWDAEERHAHADYVDAMKHAITALSICREHEEMKNPKTNAAKITKLCNEINDKIVEFWNCEQIEHDDAQHIISLLDLIGFEFSAKPKSNADRIRQMTDEELAESLSGSVACTHVTGCLDTSCYECTLEWLKQEVSEDAAD